MRKSLLVLFPVVFLGCAEVEQDPSEETVDTVAALSAATPAITFGTVNVGEKKSRTFEWRNETRAAVKPVVKVTGADATSFSLSSKGPDGCITATVKPGKTCRVDLAFAPTTSGAKSAKLGVSVSDVAVASIDVSGTAKATPPKPAPRPSASGSSSSEPPRPKPPEPPKPEPKADGGAEPPEPKRDGGAEPPKPTPKPDAGDDDDD